MRQGTVFVPDLIGSRNVPTWRQNVTAPLPVHHCQLHSPPLWSGLVMLVQQKIFQHHTTVAYSQILFCLLFITFFVMKMSLFADCLMWPGFAGWQICSAGDWVITMKWFSQDKMLHSTSTHCFNQFDVWDRDMQLTTATAAISMVSYSGPHSRLCACFCHSKSEIFGSWPWHRCSHCYSFNFGAAPSSAVESRNVSNPGLLHTSVTSVTEYWMYWQQRLLCPSVPRLASAAAYQNTKHCLLTWWYRFVNLKQKILSFKNVNRMEKYWIGDKNEN